MAAWCRTNGKAFPMSFGYITLHFGGHNINSLLLCRFAGNMERQQADNLLKSHSSGTYLIRERTAEAERFAISIKWVFLIVQEREKSQGEVFIHISWEIKILSGCPSQLFSLHLLAPANHHSAIASLFIYLFIFYNPVFLCAFPLRACILERNNVWAHTGAVIQWCTGRNAFAHPSLRQVQRGCRDQSFNK